MPTEEPKTIREVLEATIGKSAEEPATEPEPAPAEEDEPETPSDKEPDDSQAGDEDESPKDDEAEGPEKDADKPEDAKQAKKSKEDIAAPDDWPASEKALFGKLPADLRKTYLESKKAILADAGRKWEEAANLRKQYEPIDQLVKPYENDFAKAGIEPHSYFKQLMAYDIAMRKDPAGTLKELAARNGIDLASLNKVSDDDYDPAKIRQEFKRELDNRDAERNRQWQAQQTQERSTWVEEFATSKDDGGNPKYPLFTTLFADMQPYIRGATSKGDAFAILSNAYEKALWANPDQRKIVLAEEERKRTEKEIAERKASLAKAKKANGGVDRSSKQSSGDEDGMTVRQMLEANVTSLRA